MNKAIALDVRKEIVIDHRVAGAIGVLFFVLATALGAFVRIPIKASPVPITLQTFFVLLSSAVIGRRLGTASQAAYLILGIAGVPLFQGSAFGLAHLAGPTGGYIIGFIAAAYLIGSIVRTAPESAPRAAVAFLAGTCVIYSSGVLWLVGLYRMSIAHAFTVGVLPFIAGDLLKAACALTIYLAIAKRAHQIFTL